MTTPSAQMPAYLHLDQNTLADIWQENRFFAGWDPETRSGFRLHLKLMPNNELFWLRAILQVGDQRASITRRHRDVNGFDYPEIHIDVSDQEGIGIRMATLAHPTRDTQDYAGGVVRKPCTTTMSMDVSLSSKLPVLDWQQGANEVGVGDGHIEQGYAWKGTLRVGDATVEGTGLGWRDQSWGNRTVNTQDLPHPTWFAFAVHPQQQQQIAVLSTPNKGIAHLMDRHGSLTSYSNPVVTVTEGEARQRDFHKLEIELHQDKRGLCTVETSSPMIMSTEQLRVSLSMGRVLFGGPEGEWFGYFDLNQNVRGADMRAILESIGADF